MPELEKLTVNLSPVDVGQIELLVEQGFYAIIFSLRNWRCPACDSYLGRGWNPRFFSRCGAALQ